MRYSRIQIDVNGAYAFPGPYTLESYDEDSGVAVFRRWNGTRSRSTVHMLDNGVFTISIDSIYLIPENHPLFNIGVLDATEKWENSTPWTTGLIRRLQ